MRWNRRRIGLVTLLCTVTIIAIALAGIIHSQHRTYLNAKEEYHNEQMIAYLMEAANSYQLAADEARMGRKDSTNKYYGEGQENDNRAQYHLQVRKLYKAALSDFWPEIPIEPPRP